jgi:ketosteroid isomerase-like protein
MTTTDRERADTPEDLARLFVERANADDADGIAELYEPDAVLGYPAGAVTVGRDAIRALFEKVVTMMPTMQVEEPLPTLYYGDLALTATQAADGTAGRAQVARRQADGNWLRILDRPEGGRPVQNDADDRARGLEYD